MKCIGLIGGISWHSTAEYYSIINRLVNDKLGDIQSAEIILHSVNYHDFKQLELQGKWDDVGRMLASVATNLERAGCECVVLCSNTPHMVADIIARSIRIPFIHVADTAANELRRQGVRKVGLLGTRFTMESSFFVDRLSQAGIETILPDTHDRTFIHESIMKELARGSFLAPTRTAFLYIIDRLRMRGAEGVILGCSEIPLLLRQQHCSLRTFDTVAIHARAVVDYSLANN